MLQWKSLEGALRNTKMRKKVIIIGAGGHANVVADIIKKSGDSVVGFLDDFSKGENILGSIDKCTEFNEYYFVIGIGNNSVRRKIAETYKALKYHTAIHPTAVIGEDVCIGNGTVVMANAVINSGTKIRNHCIINTAGVIEHDNDIADYVHVSPNATLCGTVSVGANTHIGAAAVVKNNISICNDVVVGCGGCVVKDITVPGVYTGVPARLSK